MKMSLLLQQCMWLLWFFAGCAAEQSTDDVPQLYLDVLASYKAWPPLDTSDVWTSNTTEPIHAVFTSAILSIDLISPSTSEFTISSRKLLYWNKDACNQTEAHRYACDNLVRDLHFLTPLRTRGDPDIKYELHLEEVHEQEFEELGQPGLTPSLDLVEDQVTYRQQFDMRTYPYEFHYLEVQIESLYSANIVNLAALPIDVTELNPTVPAGWTLRDVQCSVKTYEAGPPINDPGDVSYSLYTCTILVSRENVGWWMTSFLLFIGLNFIAYVGGAGVTSHLVAEARDDKDGARKGLFDGHRLIGVFSLGLLLTYVFQVELSPYGQPIEFWPSTAASTMIYILGLVGILIASLLSMVSAMHVKKILVVDGFKGGVMRAYDLEELPLAGEVSEEAFPLLDTNDPDDAEKQAPGRGASAQAGCSDQNLTQDESVPVPAAEESGIPDAEDSGIPDVVKIPTMEHDNLAAKQENPAPEEKTRESRKINTKMYAVLSVQEAKEINAFVLIEFYTRTFVIFAIAVAGMAIMIKAKVDYDSAVG